MHEIVEQSNELELIKIKNKIYHIRGIDVMLDSDLAKLYNCVNGTKSINQAVNRNLDRFPEDFYFQLSKEEYQDLKSQIGTANSMSRTLPYAFTEQGVAMLSSVLKTKVASNVSIQIMRAFVLMKHVIGSNLKDQRYLYNKVLKNTEDIRILQDAFKEFKLNKNEIYFEGQIYDAYSKIVDIFKEAKEELIIIDGYADKSVLDMIKDLKVNIILITKTKSMLKSLDIQKYNKEYSNLSVIHNDNYHDRFFIIDKKKVYHCGSSVNYAGVRTFAINKIEEKSMIDSLINKVLNEINSF